MAYHNQSNQICVLLDIVPINGIWPSENPFNLSLAFFVAQLSVTLILTRTIFYILMPLRQPRFIANVIGGILMGPSAFGNTTGVKFLFPLRSTTTLETIGYLALILHAFLVGLQTDLSQIMQLTKKTIAYASAGFAFSFASGIGLFYFARRAFSPNSADFPASSCVYLSVSLTVTGFPVVSEILTNLRIFKTDFGQMSLLVALLNDLLSWVLIASAIPLTFSPNNFVFSLTAVVALTMSLTWLFGHTSHSKDTYSEYYLCFVLIGAIVCSALADIIGTHQVIGAFGLGLAMPNDKLRVTLIKRFEDVVSGILMPLFFVICGLKVNFYIVGNWGLVVPFVLLSCVVKVVGSVLVSLAWSEPIKEGFALGLIMNTKGVLALVMLNVSWDKKFLAQEEYAVMVIATLVTTMLTPPIVSLMYKPSKARVRYNNRSIHKLKPESEIRILTCLYSVSNVPSIIDLLDLLRPSKESPLCLFPLHLVQLTGRSSAMLIVHSNRSRSFSSAAASSSGRGGITTFLHNHNFLPADTSFSDKIISSFQEFEQRRSGTATVQPLTAVSPFNVMHEDIRSVTEDNRAAFMILPFQELIGAAATDESARLFRRVTLNVLDDVPCSVGILVDRNRPADPRTLITCNVAVIFISGPDDREALSFTWKLVGHPRVKVTLIRFVTETDEIEAPANLQRELDEKLVNDFRLGEDSVNYKEIAVKNAEETLTALKEMDHDYNLYVVGQGIGLTSPATEGLSEWIDYPELGCIGGFLVVSGFVTGLLLVIQQYRLHGDKGEQGRDTARIGEEDEDDAEDCEGD